MTAKEFSFDIEARNRMLAGVDLHAETQSSSFDPASSDLMSASMKQQLKNLIERVLIARPDASAGDIRNLIPALRDKTDDEIELLVAPIRNLRARSGR